MGNVSSTIVSYKEQNLKENYFPIYSKNKEMNSGNERGLFLAPCATELNLTNGA